MNADTQRECPFCTETIRAVAKVCPHCRRWQTWRSFRHPVVAVGFHVALLGVLLVWSTTSLQRIFNPSPYYTEFRDSLQILESRMNWVKGEKEMRIYMTGILTNQSPIAWKDIELECRFYDANGVLIDASNSRAYMTIQPSDDSAFRTSIIPTRPTNDYASFKLSISTARNTKSAF